MTKPKVLRVFFAIDLTEMTKKEVGKYINLLKKNSKSNNIRWTKPENLHITLQFLADVQGEHLEELISSVRLQMAGKMEKSILHFGAIHLFPNPYRPRVIVLKIEPQEKLAMLAGNIGKGIEVLNYPVETRPFRAHLTLGRIKKTRGANLDFLSASNSPTFADMEMNEVVLFRSDPAEEGSIYTILEKISLI